MAQFGAKTAQPRQPLRPVQGQGVLRDRDLASIDGRRRRVPEQQLPAQAGHCGVRQGDAPRATFVTAPDNPGALDKDFDDGRGETASDEVAEIVALQVHAPYHLGDAVAFRSDLACDNFVAVSCFRVTEETRNRAKPKSVFPCFGNS